jgi:glycosyltransferase involved in cell wall biosynthesis
MNQLVSLIMPVYNAEAYIYKAIKSIIDQTYDNWELIVVNDGSIDNSKQIIESFCDSRIILFTQNNSGVSSARNLGLKNCIGSFIIFIDADDWLPIDSISIRIENFYLSNIDIIDGAVSIHNSKSDLVKIYTRYPSGEGFYHAMILKMNSNHYFGLLSLTFKREIIINFEFEHDMSHCEDLLFLFKIVAYNKNIYYKSFTQVIYCYRKEHISAMSNILKLCEGYKKVLDKVIVYNLFTKKQKIVLLIKTYLLVFKILIKNKMYLKINFFIKSFFISLFAICI